ncbi:MAG: hypothetical protein RL885_01710 [Planctomycetota bacterium]
MNWIAFCLLSLLPLSAPTPRPVDNQPCILKLNLTTGAFMCFDADCTPCDELEVTMEGTTITRCSCSGGGSYDGTCWGKGETVAGQSTLICIAGTSCNDCDFDADGTWKWCICQ